MKLPRNLILPLLIFLSQTNIISAVDKWFSLGNYIEEEGTDDKAGTAVSNSRDGSTIAVSSPHYIPKGDDGEPLEGSRYGRVMVYDFDPEFDKWNKVGDEIVGERGESLGISMKLSEDGKTVVVGCLSDSEDSTQLEVGSVKVYALDGLANEWKPKGETLYGTKAYDRFGTSVDIADGGAVITVGSPGHDEDVLNDAGAVEGVLNDAGSVRVYKYDISLDEWRPIQNAMVGTSAFAKFGSSVSLSQVGSVAIGAPLADNSRGYVQMYHYNATDETWDVRGDAINGAKPGDQFGASVAMSYDASTVAVGSPLLAGYGTKKRSGSVTVFEYTDSMWKVLGEKIIGRDEGDEFGSSVDMSDDGKEIAVGSPFSTSDFTKKQAGHITVYHYDGRGQATKKWNKRHLEIEGKVEYSHQGSSVGLSGDGYQVIGGAPTEGYASVYTLEKTAPPTMAPTVEREIDVSGGRSGFAAFVLVIFFISLIAATVWFVFKGVVYYRNKSRQDHYPNNNGVEMRQVEVIDEGEGII